MPDTFYHFGNLPRELRDEIWSFAVGPAHSGVHVCPIYDRKQGDKDFEPLRRETLNAILRRQYEVLKHYLWLDQHHEDKDIVVGGDKGGMWNACRESRLMMEKHTKGPLETYFDNELTAFFTHAFPSANIFYLVPITSELETIIKNDGHHGTTFDHMVDQLTGQSDLVIEYNPEWDLEIAKKRISELNYSQLLANLVSPSVYLCWLNTIWLVDYNIKRVPFVPKEVECKGSDVLFCVGDRRFVDVDTNRSEWNLHYRNQAGVDIRAQTTFEQLSSYTCRTVGPNRMESYLWCSLGLLACEHI